MTRSRSTADNAEAISHHSSLNRAVLAKAKNVLIAAKPSNAAKPLWCIALAMSLACINASCSRNDDSNLWRRTFATTQRESTARGLNQLNGYWQGEVAMGDIRTKIEAGKITISMKCSSDGSSVAQASAATIVSTDAPPRIILQGNLDSTRDDACGFHFYKGNQFVFTLERPDLLKINFAGSAVSELKKLADLDVGT
jgi:hypothetical protein